MKDLFKYNHPELFKEVHPTKNLDLDFESLRNNSGKKIWWQCKRNKKHVWQQSITRRAKKGYGCPFCSGLKTIPEESFAARYPVLAKEIHPTKNPGFGPFHTAPKSNKNIWWICPHGHEWKGRIDMRTIRNKRCPTCHIVENSLAKRYPELADEWHPTKNFPLTPELVRPSKNITVWWQCKNDSSHVWKTKLASRTFSKTPCPQCIKTDNSSRKGKSLQENNPDLSKQWHTTKNKLTPSDVSPNSRKKAWWICPNNREHIWEANIYNRAVRGRGCPICANRALSPENSLAKKYPDIASQWHPTKNGELTPNDVSYGSSLKVWWQCKSKEKHEWQEIIHLRTQRNKIECPVCSKSRFAYSNSLEAIFPEIAAQWHPTKNGELTPAKVTKASGRKVWWKCSVNPEHEWESQIKNRTLLNSGCRYCAMEKNIIRLSQHLFELDHKDINYYHIFLNSIHSIEQLLSLNIKNERLRIPFYRMLFSSIITAIETYFSDAFIKCVFSKNEYIEKFVTTNPELNKRNYNFFEAMDIYTNIEKSIKEYLLNIIWHNIPKVQNMYKSVFDIDFPDDITFLLKAITIRHDIVHRNGKAKSGAIVKISKQQIEDLITDSKSLIEKINLQIEKAER